MNPNVHKKNISRKANWPTTGTSSTVLQSMIKLPAVLTIATASRIASLLQQIISALIAASAKKK